MAFVDGSLARPRRFCSGALGLVVVVLTLLLAACSDGSSLEDQASGDLDRTESADGDGLGGDAGETDPDTSSPDRLASVASGTLRLGMLSPIPNGPTEASPVDSGQLMVADLLADGLTQLDADGAPAPALAQSWQHNEDATSWTFTLRPDAQFSDGSLITASDVKRSLEAVASDPGLLAGEMLAQVVGFGEARGLSGLIAVDDVTLRIDLTKPVRYLDVTLAMPALGINGVNRAETSGQWSIMSRSSDRLVLSRQAHDATDSGAGPQDPDGTVDRIEISQLDDAQDARRAFESGEVDLVWLGLGVTDPDATYFDGHVTAFLGSRINSDVVGEADIRSSLELAIDRQSLVSDIFGDSAQPLWGLVPSGLAADAITCARDCFDRAEAQGGLTELRTQSVNPTITLDYPSGSWQSKMAIGVAGDLESVGLVIETRASSDQDMADVLATDDVDLFLIGSVAQSASAEAYLTSLFGTAANQNLTGFSSPIVDGLSDVGGTTASRAEQLVLAEDPAIPLAQFDHSVLLGDRVETVELRLDGTIVIDRLKLG